MRSLILHRSYSLELIRRAIAWHARFYLRKVGYPLTASVFVTDSCNSRCTMCNIWKNKPGHILQYEIQRAHAEALGRLGCYYYTVTGGEPTLVPDLVERLGYAASMIPYVRLVSNGLALTSDLARSLGKARIKEITISIDG